MLDLFIYEKIRKCLKNSKYHSFFFLRESFVFDANIPTYIPPGLTLFLPFSFLSAALGAATIQANDQ